MILGLKLYTLSSRSKPSARDKTSVKIWFIRSVFTQVEVSDLLKRGALVHIIPTFYPVGEGLKDFDVPLIWSTLLQWRMKGFRQAFDYFHNRIVHRFGVDFLIK
jgi:hypothetical protein